MNLPEIDKYAHVESFFSSWSPHVKVASLSFLMVSLATLPDILVALVGFAVASSLAFASRLPLRFIIGQLKWALVFVLLITVALSLTGEELLSGIKLGILIGLRALGILLVAITMLGTAKFPITLKALEKLKVPRKLVHLVMFTYRYIFVLMDEMSWMIRAAKSRGFKKKTNIFALKTLDNLAGMLFARGFERTQRIYQAMLSWGYKGEITTIDELRATKADYLKASLVVAVAFGLLAVAW